MEPFSETYNGDFNLFMIFSELALLPTKYQDFVPIELCSLFPKINAI